jgi:3D (Asp-Asp-Asp) domain-containing protein
MKRRVIGLAVEVLLATALTLSLTPTSVRADIQASQTNQSPEMTTQTEQDPVGEQALADNGDEDALEPMLHHFVATGYCLRGNTATGVRVNPGTVAADPDVLPMGSVIRLHAGEYSGIYTVLDTGLKVRGRRLDIWFPSYKEAVAFGVRKVKVEIIRYGWEPDEKEIGNL